MDLTRGDKIYVNLGYVAHSEFLIFASLPLRGFSLTRIYTLQNAYYRRYTFLIVSTAVIIDDDSADAFSDVSHCEFEEVGDVV